MLQLVCRRICKIWLLCHCNLKALILSFCYFCQGRAAEESEGLGLWLGGGPWFLNLLPSQVHFIEGSLGNSEECFLIPAFKRFHAPLVKVFAAFCCVPARTTKPKMQSPRSMICNNEWRSGKFVVAVIFQSQGSRVWQSEAIRKLGFSSFQSCFFVPICVLGVSGWRHVCDICRS